MTDGIKTYLDTSFFGMLLAFCLVFIHNPANAQDVIRASGGTDLSVDSVATGGYTEISGPNIRETSSGQLLEGETIILTLPDGYEWNTNLTEDEISIEEEGTGANNTQLRISFTSISTNEAVLTVDKESSTSGGGQGPGRADITGLELRPSDRNVPDEGEISNTGTTGPTDANYGDLSKEAGEATNIRIETEDDGSGNLVEEQDLTAGVELQVFAIARDEGDNFVENIALNDDSDWNLINTTGDVTESALNPADNLRSATFNSEKTGSTQIEVSHPDFNQDQITASETITVTPREAREMVIITEPSSTATAGESFDTQPVIELRDRFDNLVTTDDETEITASINSGDGTLSGTETEQASAGEINFSNLSSDIANAITLRFESSELDAITSEEIDIEAADPSQLIYLEQPTNTLPGNTIDDPPVELQLLDEFDNEVETDTIDVSISEESGSFLDSGATTTVSTNSDGIAIFDDLLIDSGASEGEEQLEASSADFSSTATSEPFDILGEGELAKFEIETEGGGDINEQEAGESFNIQITAIDGSGATFTDFDGTVNISADADISVGEGETASFTDGQLDSHSITLTSFGSTRMYAENADENRDGRSNEFTVTPTDLDTDSTELTADPDDITADGNSTSEITLQAKDEFGNNLDTGGETVWITTDEGSLSSDNGDDQTGLEATDNGDGTYTATLTSTSSADTATIEAFTDDQDGDKLGETTVEFSAGDLDAFSIDVPQENGSPQIQTAGESFDITVKALDDNDNIIPDFDGDLVFESDSEISSGETASGNNFTDGELVHSITLTESGDNVTISVEQDNLDDESGTSEELEVIAPNPDADESRISSSPSTIQNDNSSESDVTVTLRDQFGNRVYEEKNVSLDLEQLEEDDDASSGTPDASVSEVSFDSNNGIYNATLTATETIELVEISASFNGSTLNETTEIDIVLPNTWEPDCKQCSQDDWENGDNWSQGSVPEQGDFVIIPDEDDMPEVDVNVDVGSFEIQEGAAIDLLGGNAISLDGNLTVDGNLNIENNTDITTGGNFEGSGTFTSGDSTSIEVAGNINIDSFLAREDESVTRLNGDSQQLINSSEFLAERLEIRNEVLVESGDIIDNSVLDISEGNTLELQQDADITLDVENKITGDGDLILNNNNLVVRGDLDLGSIDASDATVILGIRTDPDGYSEDDFSELEQQEIADLSEMKNVVINNTKGVRTFEDIIVDGDLTLEKGDHLQNEIEERPMHFTTQMLLENMSEQDPGEYLRSILDKHISITSQTDGKLLLENLQNWWRAQEYQNLLGNESKFKHPVIILLEE